MKKLLILIFILLTAKLYYGSESIINDTGFPITSGKLVFHRYTEYGANNGTLHIYDFALDTLINISKNWNLINTINGHFAPDGSELVFMAKPKGQTSYYSWNVYKWSLESMEQPYNLTSNSNVPNEDPKYFYDGKRVVIKQNGDIKIINLSNNSISAITSDGFSIEESMPYPTADDQNVIYAKNGKVFMINIDGTNDHAVTSENNVESYYPIVRDNETFLYPRNASSMNKHDEIYIGYINSNDSKKAPFNKINDDDSDPYPVKNTDYVFFSSTRSGGSGNWDIYLGDIVTGQVWSLEEFGINSSISELGSAYYISTQNNIEINENAIINNYDLGQNYPNPFNPVTTISFSLPNLSNVKLKVYNSLGQEIIELVNQQFSQGNHKIKFDASKLRSGIYFYRIQTGTFIDTKKMLLIR